MTGQIFVGGGVFLPSGFERGPHALWVEGGRIARVASIGDGCDLPRSAGTRVIHLGSALLLPGFIDAHTHLGIQTRERRALDLRGTTGISHLLAALSARVKSAPPGTWIVGIGWDDSRLEERRPPNLTELDAAAPDHPVLLRRVCGHAGVVNSRALSLLPAEITAGDPKNGLIREQALWKTEDLIPRDLAVLKQDFGKILTHISALGITSVHEMIDGEDTLELLDRAGDLPLEIFCYLPLAMSDRFGEIRRHFQAKKGRVEVVGVKIFADGSIGAGTAALEKPYRGEPENRGSLLFSDREMAECLEKMARLGAPFAIHAIGDRAISQILDVAPERLRERPPGWNRIEHAELLRNDHLERVKRGGFSLSMQPNFVVSWQSPGGLYEQKVGERGRRANPFRQVWEAGIPLCFGSDSMPSGPLLGIQGALDHPVAARRLSLWQAVLAYTRASAAAVSQETRIGSIAVGYQADLVAVTPDFVASPSAASVVLTAKAGEIVYSRAG